MNQLEYFAQIEVFVFDIDGVMTNNEVLLLEDGELVRKMNIRDGLALKMAIQHDFRVAVISGGYSHGVRKRLESLGIEDLYLGVKNKLEVFESFIELYNIDPGKVLYMGDDLPDYPVLRRVGLPTCPVDAAPEVIEVSQYISPLKGGAGCVRDVIEKVLRLKGKWE